jgi:SAM-dependent methyltransferase
MKMLKSLLRCPLADSLDLDDPETLLVRRRILREKVFLRRIYEEWYRKLLPHVPPGTLPVLEMGSGAGFLSGYVPGLITSDVFKSEGIQQVVCAERLPFDDAGLRAILMTNVLHHVPEPRCFFAEAARCLAPAGTICMVEPWVTLWSRWVYARFHHEPFDPAAAKWSFNSAGPMSGANGALPWMIFERDRDQFELEFPSLAIRTVEPMMPFRYLLSGGMSRRSLMPAWTFDFWQAVERLLGPCMRHLGMFALVVIVRKPVT